MSAAAGKGKQTLCLAQRNTLALRTAGRTQPTEWLPASRSRGGKAEGLRAAQTEKGSQQPWDSCIRQKHPKGRAGWGPDRAKADLQLKSNLERKCLALEVLELLFNPKTAQLSELRI